MTVVIILSSESQNVYKRLTHVLRIIHDEYSQILIQFDDAKDNEIYKAGEIVMLNAFPD